MFQDNMSLKDIVNLEKWREIQESLSEVLEVGISTFSLNGTLLSQSGRLTHICNKLFAKNSTYRELCNQCILCRDKENFPDVDEETHFQCFLDLNVFLIPITAVGNKKVAYIAVGPLFLNRRKDNAEYVEDARRLGIDLESLIDVLLDINTLSYNKMHSTNKMIKDIFSNMAQTGYHKQRLAEMAPEIKEMDPLFAHYYEERILSSLLNACTLALDADSGSVMTLEKKTNTLHIKVATKLDEKVVNNTFVKLGEGIAGIAAATAKPIILPNDESKKALSGRLKRHYIKSSMIVPFNKPLKKNQGDVYGVINLNVVRKERKFSEKDIALVQELIDLGSVALVPIQNLSTQRKPLETNNQ